MKTILTPIIFYLFFNLFLFLAISFYYVSFDVKTWEEGARYLFASLGIFISLIISVAMYFINNKN
jgi:hypothetical protein